MYAILGADPDTWTPSADAFLEQIVEEDREMVTERFLAGQQEGRSPSTRGSSASTARWCGSAASAG